ncbi:unnamed protein product [Spodoptera exigua]|nr:unnamed protein product [Spodoptera exigua]
MKITTQRAEDTKGDEYIWIKMVSLRADTQLEYQGLIENQEPTLVQNFWRVSVGKRINSVGEPDSARMGYHGLTEYRRETSHSVVFRRGKAKAFFLLVQAEAAVPFCACPTTPGTPADLKISKLSAKHGDGGGKPPSKWKTKKIITPLACRDTGATNVELLGEGEASHGYPSNPGSTVKTPTSTLLKNNPSPESPSTPTLANIHSSQSIKARMR